VENLIDNEKVAEILNFHNENKKLIAAICAAPNILDFNGILPPDAKITSHPSVRSILEKYDYSEDTIVEFGNILTSRAAGTSLQFGFYLLEKLVGTEIAVHIKNSIVY
jgi:putative intracellular protease/amidase